MGRGHMAASSRAGARPLSPMEQGVWKMDQAAPLNFTTVARVRGPLDPAALVDALARVRLRHPHLRARIAADDAGWPWFRPCDAAIPLRVAAEGWSVEVEREVNTPIPAEAGPLARCVLVWEGPDDARLLVTLHHSVGDGMSGAFLVRDLLTALASGGQGALEPLTDTRPSEGRLPAKARGLRGLWARMRYVARELRSACGAIATRAATSAAPASSTRCSTPTSPRASPRARGPRGPRCTGRSPPPRCSASSPTRVAPARGSCSGAR